MSRRSAKPTPETVKADNYPGISKQELLELKDAFSLLDPNNSGKIEVVELQNLMNVAGVAGKSLQIALNQAALVSKSIDFSSFIEIFTAHLYAPKSRGRYSQVFRLFDDENVGCITAKNLRRAVKEMDMNVSEAEIQQMVDRADINNDGVIDQEEFYQIMTKISSKI